MSDHFTAVYCSAYYLLRQPRVITRSLSDAAKMLIQEFIS